MPILVCETNFVCFFPPLLQAVVAFSPTGWTWTKAMAQNAPLGPGFSGCFGSRVDRFGLDLPNWVLGFILFLVWFWNWCWLSGLHWFGLDLATLELGTESPVLLASLELGCS